MSNVAVALSSKYNNNLNRFLLVPNVFTDEECEKILAFSGEFKDSTVTDANTHKKVHDYKERVALVKDINYSNENEWLFKKLFKIVKDINSACFNFLIDSIQDTHIIRYEEGGFVKWHVDIGNEQLSVRKLSVVILLSNSNEYEGGELEFNFQKEPLSKERGSLVIFPSYIAHEVKPVTKGVRQTFVAWVCGPHFR